MIEPTEQLTVLTADDEPLARRIIRRQLKEEPRVRTIVEAGDGDEAFEMIRRHEPELVFLDIQMLGCNGFELLEKLRAAGLASPPVIVFVTAFDQFALRAFEFHALDYLLKPFDRDRFRAAFERAVDKIRADNQAEYQQKLLRLVADLETRSRRPEWVSVRRDDKISLFSVEGVMWIEAQGNYALLRLTDTKNLVRGKMDQLEAKLDASKFIRIHRSVIINIAFVKEIEDWGRGEYKVVMTSGRVFNVSKTYRANLEAFFNIKVL